MRTSKGSAELAAASSVRDVLDFVLPDDLHATRPPEARGLRRDGVRLMVSHRSGGPIEHLRFSQIERVLRAGDLLVINTSATRKAALLAERVGGELIHLHLSTRLPSGAWLVELRRPSPQGTAPLFDAAAGETVRLPGGARATLLAPHRAGVAPEGVRLWEASLTLTSPVDPYLDEFGFPIRYGYVPQPWPIESYQNVYSTEPGSAEMPSAGRGFTPDLITRLAAVGVLFAPLILHTGVASLEAGEAPYEEYYRVPRATAQMVNATRERGGRVIAVGTTVVRALETVAGSDGTVRPGEGWTDLIVSPESGAHAVNGLLTGLHEPRASHLAMLEAIGGRPQLERAYAAALSERYLWHEFGDLHLMLP